MSHLFVFFLLTSSAFAQAAHLVGLSSSSRVVHKDHAACVFLNQCNVPGFPQTIAAPTHGGSGWDPVLSGMWISNGAVIACVDDNCNYLCAPAPVVTPGAITGLEVVESLDEIWATDDQGNLVRMTRTCPPTFLSSCNTGVVSGPLQGLSGLAVDEGRQLVFYSESDFAAGTTIVHTAKMATPCTPLLVQNFAASIAVACPPNYFRVGTGLAVDWRYGEMYMTDGLHTLYTYYVHPQPNVFAWGLSTCCTMFAHDAMVGLAWRPALPVPFGAACANGTCPSCTMNHGLVNDPNLGNAQFALDLSAAPTGSLVWCLLTVGPCASPGQNIPGLCGPLWISTNSLGPPLFGGIVTGGPGCGGSATFPLPLPPIVGLANLPVASQCITLCAGAGLNTSLSNCLDWRLQAN